MIQYLWRFSLVLICHLHASPLHCQTPDAKAELDLGIAAYKEGAYPDAIQHLEHVVSLDPKITDAHLYLAMACNDMFSPAIEPGNQNGHWSGLAIREYKEVLELDPSHRGAANRLAYLLAELARYDEAEGYYRKAAALDANDPEPIYGIAVIHWQQTYRLLAEERASLGLAQEQPLIGSAACKEVRAMNLARVEEGINLLTKTLRLLKDDSAEGYMAALYEERAEMQCGDKPAYARDRRLAKQWWIRSCETRHRAKERVVPDRWISGPPPQPSQREGTCTF
jgi:tetratricopeptide (TPR) repeat protein